MSLTAWKANQRRWGCETVVLQESNGGSGGRLVVSEDSQGWVGMGSRDFTGREVVEAVKMIIRKYMKLYFYALFKKMIIFIFDVYIDKAET